jgi:hypothetical protein
MNNLHRLLKIYELWNISYNKVDSVENQPETQEKAIHMFKKILSYLTPKEKQIMKNIVICKNVVDIVNKNQDNKIKILLPYYKKYKEKQMPKFYIYSVMKLNNYTLNLLKIEYRHTKPKINKYNLLSPEQKKIYNRKRIETKINRMGYTNYRKYCVDMYKKWYNNLSLDKKLELKEKRKIRYQFLSNETKQMYRNNRKIKLANNEQRKEYYRQIWLRKREKFKSLPIDIQNKYKEDIRIKKNIYYNNISVEKRKLLNKFRTLKRHVVTNKISIDDFNNLKTNIIKDNISHFPKTDL